MGKRNYLEVHNEYKEFKKDDKEIKLVYNQVKREYLENENLNINLEKIYIEKRLNRESSETFNTNMNMMIAIVSASIAIVIEKIIPNNTIGMIATIVFIVAECILIFLIIDKNKIRKEFSSNLYYRICLLVLEEIEKERGTLQKNVSSL